MSQGSRPDRVADQLRSELALMLAREVHDPGVGFVTAEVVLAEIADIHRFSSHKQLAAYAGLSPGQRESAGKTRDLHLEKNGSGLLRWILVESAWRLVRHSPRWKGIYERLKARVQARKAIVAVARRAMVLVVLVMVPPC